jgi:hypothetical protein
MEIVVDQDMQAVAEFMQRNIPADRLVAVAKGVGDIAPILWGHVAGSPKESLRPLLLRESAIT